jgi:hypothetical protein
MMNKYALGTVLGTALLGLAKSKLGSGIRLKKISYRLYYIEFTVSFLPSEMLRRHALETKDEIVEHVEESIEDFTIRDGDDEILDVEVVNDPYLYHVGERDECVVFKIGVLYAKHVNYEGPLSWEEGVRIVEFCKEKLKEDPLGYADNIIYHPSPAHPNYELRQYGVIDKIVNADTGEEYKPKAKSSRLRKR